MHITNFAYMSGETISEVQQYILREIELVSEGFTCEGLTDEQYDKIHSLEQLLEGANNLVAYCNDRYYMFKELQSPKVIDREIFNTP